MYSAARRSIPCKTPCVSIVVASNFQLEVDKNENKIYTPKAIRAGSEKAPVNELGLRRIMFAVDDIDTVVVRLLTHGAELVGEVVQYEDTYRLAYVRGPEGIIVGLAEELRQGVDE
jgi:predicted enzyme related to lactoylglutathione lyase